MTRALWFFWGQPHMSFLRYMTLVSASRIHNDVRLVLRRNPIRDPVDWREMQDFQFVPPPRDYMEEALSVVDHVAYLEEFAPEVAAYGLPDVQTSDLFAWWVLSKCGGTVADMDIVFLKPLPEIQNDVEVVRFSGYPKAGYSPVTIMQGRPCSTWGGAFRRACTCRKEEVYESCGSGCLHAFVKPRLPETIVFPWAGRVPWSQWHSFLFNDEAWPSIPEECCGIHWYAGHNQKWNQRIQSEADLERGAVAWAVNKVLSQCACQ